MICSLAHPHVGLPPTYWAAVEVGIRSLLACRCPVITLGISLSLSVALVDRGTIIVRAGSSERWRATVPGKNPFLLLGFADPY